MWAAYWGYVKGGKVEPLLPKAAAQFVGSAPAEAGGAATQPAGMMKERIASILKNMEEAGGASAGHAVYVAAGRRYALGAGGLTEETIPESEGGGAYAWPVGHDVRPAGEALGAKGCTDCHAADSALLGGQVTALGPWKIAGAAPAVTPAWKMAGIDADDVAALSAGYSVRPYAKLAIVLAGAVLGLVVAVYGLRGLGTLLGAFGPRRGAEGGR